MCNEVLVHRRESTHATRCEPMGTASRREAAHRPQRDCHHLRLHTFFPRGAHFLSSEDKAGKRFDGSIAAAATLPLPLMGITRSSPIIGSSDSVIRMAMPV